MSIDVGLTFKINGQEFKVIRIDKKKFPRIRYVYVREY